MQKSAWIKHHAVVSSASFPGVRVCSRHHTIYSQPQRRCGHLIQALQPSPPTNPSPVCFCIYPRASWLATHYSTEEIKKHGHGSPEQSLRALFLITIILCTREKKKKCQVLRAHQVLSDRLCSEDSRSMRHGGEGRSFKCKSGKLFCANLTKMK